MRNWRDSGGRRRFWWLARLDRDIYDWLKKYGEGYSTRINNILRAVMSKTR